MINQEELLTEEGSIQITMASHHDLQVHLKVSLSTMRHYWFVARSGNPCFAFLLSLRDDPQDQIVCFFKHCSNNLCNDVHVYSVTKAI